MEPQSKPTYLMTVAVAETLWCPLRMSYLRAAGSSGMQIYLEMERQGRVPRSTEALPLLEGFEGGTTMPVGLGSKPTNVTASFEALIQTQHAWARRGSELAPIRNSTVRFHLTHADSLSYIQPFLFESNKSLEHFHIDDAPKLQLISTQFLAGCTSLRQIDLRSFSNVTTIESSFMAGSGLTSIDLRPLKHLSSVENEFLLGCRCLASVTVSESANGLIGVGGLFLSECDVLEDVDLFLLRDQTITPFALLDGCKALTTVCLAPLENITTVSARFLGGCVKLKYVDLTPLSNVTTINGNFMSRCVSLKEIDLSPFTSVTEITACFLSGCCGLEEIDLAPFVSLQTIGVKFLEGCSGLKAIDLTPLARVTEIGASFCSRCTGLRAVDVRSLRVRPPTWFTHCPEIALVESSSVTLEEVS